MDTAPRSSREKQISRAGSDSTVLALSKHNTRLKIESLGTVELKYISLNDSTEFDRLLRQELSSRDLLANVLHYQLVRPEINFADFQKLSDEDLEILARAFIKKEDYTFKYFQDTGDFFKDFKVALATGRKKYAEELAKPLQSIIQYAQEALNSFNQNYTTVIQQTITGISYIQKPLQQFARLSSQIGDIQLRITESMIPVIEQYQSAAQIIVESLFPQIDIWQRWVEQNKGIFDKVSEYWAGFQQGYNIAEQRAVKVLKKYKWFITPSFPITFIFEVMELDKKNGRHDKAVNRLFINYFEAKDWKQLEIMVSSWRTNPLLKKRYKILTDSVDTVRAASKKGINETNAVLPTLITQIDGVLTDYLNSKGLRWEVGYDDLIDVGTGKVKKVGRKSQFKSTKPKMLTASLDDLANDIFLNILFQKSQKGKPLATPFNFNRHKIIHGENVKYGRKDYLIRAYMVLDLLAHF